MSSKTLTIEIPENLYQLLQENTSTNADSELERFVINFLEDCLTRKNARNNDSIFQPITTKGSGCKDIAENHDRYLYDR